MYHFRVLGSPDLRRDDGQEVRSVLVQPKQVALLAYLALVNPERFHRRDVLVALFWPDLAAERARAALRNGLYRLRQALGAEIVETRGADEVRLAPGSVWCDAIVFTDAVAGGRLGEAVTLYGGDLLAGLYVPGAPEVEHWLDRERERLRQSAARAGWALAEREIASGDVAAGAAHARWAAEREPGSEAGLRRLMSMLERAGDLDGALSAYARFAAWLAEDGGDLPSAETRAAVEEIRARAAAARHSPPPAPEPPAPSPIVHVAPPAAAAPPSASAPAARSRRRVRVAAIAGAVAACLGFTSIAVLGSGSVDPGPRSGAVQRAEAHPSTRSPAALALFREGLRAHYAGDGKAAGELYRAAAREDTTFALAYMYAAFIGGPDRWALMDHARRMADRGSPDRERLLVRGAWAWLMDDPSAIAVADTLAIRYPEEPDAHLLLGRALVHSGRFAEAIPRFRRVVAMDTAGLNTPGARCLACEALPELVNAYHHLDSLDAVYGVIGEWRRLQPRSAMPLYALADANSVLGRYPEARSALRRAVALEDPAPWEHLRHADVNVRAGDFAAADAALELLVRDGAPDLRGEALWLQVISFRHQGRLRDALAAADRYRRERDNELPRAVVLWEMGRLREAAETFDRISLRRAPAATPSGAARWRAWSLTHRAGALAALGDTATVAALADTIQRVGARSGYRRDQLLHHHVRGLLWSARGRPDSAAAAFRRARYSPAYGYNRVNLELGRALVRAGRPAEAIPVLRAALRTGSTSTGLYTTLPQLHAALGDAWLAANRPDSAAPHFRISLNAYRRADPQFAAEVARMRALVAESHAAPTAPAAR
jgi:DNA-binding SARP family transcriptional activator/Tfp pilus assembly protein PilF